MHEVMEGIKTKLRASTALNNLGIADADMKLGYGAQATTAPALYYWPVDKVVPGEDGHWTDLRVQIDIIGRNPDEVLQIENALQALFAGAGAVLTADGRTVFSVTDYGFNGPADVDLAEPDRHQASVDFVVHYRENT